MCGGESTDAGAYMSFSKCWTMMSDAEEERERATAAHMSHWYAIRNCMKSGLPVRKHVSTDSVTHVHLQNNEFQAAAHRDIA